MSSNKQILIVKVGTGTLRKSGHIHPPIFYTIASQIAAVKKTGTGVVLVSSGAVDAGRDWVLLLGKNPEIFNTGELSSIGSEPLLALWKEAFLPHCLGIALGWVTNGTWTHKGEKENLRVSARRFAASDFVLVVNEHDLLSRAELVKMRRGEGDNDYLARRIACLIDANSILFLTESGGIFNGRPGSSVLYRELDGRATFRLRARDNGVSDTGTGGPQSKINQASICFRRGMRAAIAGVREREVIARFARGENVGTTITNRTVLAV